MPVSMSNDIIGGFYQNIFCSTSVFRKDPHQFFEGGGDCRLLRGSAAGSRRRVGPRGALVKRGWSILKWRLMIPPLSMVAQPLLNHYVVLPIDLYTPPLKRRSR